jgi:hypothetical protein
MIKIVALLDRLLHIWPVSTKVANQLIPVVLVPVLPITTVVLLDKLHLIRNVKAPTVEQLIVVVRLLFVPNQVKQFRMASVMVSLVNR